MKIAAGRKMTLNEELNNAFKVIRENGYGSIEIFVQGGVVTQITVRNIKKTKVDIKNGRSYRLAIDK